MSLVDVFDASVAGAEALLAWRTLGFLLIGVLVGGLVGILPGLGGAAALAIVLPFAIGLSPTDAFALLMGVAAVVATTGDLTSILVGIPGEATAAATVVDGHPMAVRGEAARAVGASLFSSLAGSLLGAGALVLTIPAAAAVARAVGSPELFMLALLGISCVAPLSDGSRLKGVVAGGLGLLLATVGLDSMTSTPRFTFGQLSLWDGISPVPVALGLFAIPEIAGLAAAQRAAPSMTTSIGSRLSDGLRDVRRLWRLVLQSSAIGTATGIVPGIGASVSQWMAYGVAARRRPEGLAFGAGAVEGVIAPSAANNATLGGSLVPALALGIPGGLMSALLLSALIMKGIVPGPSMLAPEAQGGHLTLVFSLVWLLVAANVLAVTMSGVGARVLARITTVPAVRMVPFLLLLTFLGGFAERQSATDVILTGVMGAVGLAMARYRWPRAPVVMGLVLGSLAETRLFISVAAYDWTWLWRPGVLMLAGLIVVGFAFPIRSRTAETDGHRAPHASSPGERVWMAALIGLCTVAIVMAGEYPERAALLPRAIAVATAALLLVNLVSTSRSASSASPASCVPDWRGAVLWMPVFLVLIWAFGFLVGAPLAVLVYFVSAERQTLRFAATSAGLTWMFLYGVLFRLLSLPFPSGAAVEWVGGGRI